MFQITFVVRQSKMYVMEYVITHLLKSRVFQEYSE